MAFLRRVLSRCKCGREDLGEKRQVWMHSQKERFLIAIARSLSPHSRSLSPSVPPIKMRVVGAAASSRSHPVAAPRSRASGSAGVSALAQERSYHRLASPHRRPPTAAKKIIPTLTATTSVAAAAAAPAASAEPANDAKQPFASKSWTWRGFPIKYHESGDGKRDQEQGGS